jgi:hypothetical protein
MYDIDLLDSEIDVRFMTVEMVMEDKQGLITDDKIELQKLRLEMLYGFKFQQYPSWIFDTSDCIEGTINRELSSITELIPN